MHIGVLLEQTGLHDDLVSGLKSAGIRVDELIVPPALSKDLALGLGRSFLETAETCDLMHNLSGCLGLLFARLSHVPMVTSVAGVLTEEEALFCRAAAGGCFFVSESAGVLPGLREVPGAPRFDGDRVRFYLDVYSRVLALGRTKEDRPWGGFETLSDNRDDHKVKRITVLPGKRLSLQYHGRRKEHWIIISGHAMARVGDALVELGPSETLDIPCGAAHRIENIGAQDLVLIEVQQGHYFGEDDIVRIEDDFGRT